MSNVTPRNAILGSSIDIKGTFSDQDGPVDPTVTAWILKPRSSTEHPLTPVNETGVGVWSAQYDTTSSDPEGVYAIYLKGVLDGHSIVKKLLYSCTR